MKSFLFTAFLLLFLAGSVQQCTDSKASEQPIQPHFTELTTAQKDAYWNAGKAEIASFELEQARYGEIRKGEAIMVFVTEPFSASKQVKLDDPVAAASDRLDVLKMNFTRKFFTGIYPYSTETSVFIPYNQDGIRKDAVKFNSSIQEWCGHTFTQFNQKKEVYDWVQFSYFESEGDHNGQLKNAIPEDELWSLVRMGPDKLPLGNLNMIPALQYLRFSHEEIQAYEAFGKLESAESGKATYTLLYTHNQRELSITFNDVFPYEIESWKETYRDGWGEKAAVLTTKGTRKALILDEYWSHNANQDSTFRNALKMN